MYTEVQRRHACRLYRNKKGRTRRDRRVRFLYLADEKFLTVTIPTMVRKTLHVQLSTEITLEIVAMDLFDSWATLEATKYQQRQNSGEGDFAGCPLPKLQEWPTLVIEAGYSQSWASLHTKMRWWFTASKEQVKIVLLAKFEAGHNKIVLEKWKPAAILPRPGATATRSSSTHEPRREQLIVIQQEPTANPANPAPYTVHGGGLVLKFNDLFVV